MTPDSPPFELRAVAHLVQPWGRPAADVEELRQGIAAAPDGVLFQHAIQFPLRHPAAEELPPDDWSAWLGAVVQDGELAERMSFAVQGHLLAPSELRREVLAVLESVPERRRRSQAAPEWSPFVFLRGHAHDYAVGVSVANGGALVEALMGSDPSVWFFHLVGDPWRNHGESSLLHWLELRGESRLASWLRLAAGSGLPIDKARARLFRRWRQSRLGSRLAEAVEAPPDVRREVARATLARMLRRKADGESR